MTASASANGTNARTAALRRERGFDLAIFFTAAGVAWIVQRAFEDHVPVSTTWPGFILLAGAYLFFLGYRTQGVGAEWLGAFGVTAMMAGALLLFQLEIHAHPPAYRPPRGPTYHWEMWIYAWPLVVPAGPGFGLWAVGRGKSVRRVRALALGGLAAFVVGALFCEAVLHLGDYAFTRRWPLLPPIVLVVLGAILFLVWRGGRSKG